MTPQIDNTIRGVFFDLYGTLIPYADMQVAWQTWLTTLHQLLTDSGNGLDFAQLTDHCEGLFSSPEPAEIPAGQTVYEARLAGLCGRLNCKTDSTLLRLLADRTVAAWQAHLTLDPDVRSLLTRLKTRYATGLITNFDHTPHIEVVLRDHQLESLFDVIVISDAERYKKPDPRIFRSALEKTNLRPEEVIFIGDSPSDDVAGAHAAGIRPILIERTGTTNQGDTRDFARKVGAKFDESATPPWKTIARLTELTSILQIQDD